MKYDNTNRHGVKFSFKLTKPNIMSVINRRLDIRQMLGEKFYIEMIGYLQAQKSEADLVKFLIEPVGIYTEPTKEPKVGILRDIVDKFGIIQDEHFYLNHESRDDSGRGVISEKTLMCFPLYVRANQQIADKEGRSADDDIGRNVAGQVSSKASRAGTLTDSEIATAIAQDAHHVMEELLGPASHDLEAKREMKQQIYKTGKFELSKVEQKSMNKRSLQYFSEILKALSIDNDLIQPLVK